MIRGKGSTTVRDASGVNRDRLTSSLHGSVANLEVTKIEVGDKQGLGFRLDAYAGDQCFEPATTRVRRTVATIDTANRSLRL